MEHVDSTSFVFILNVSSGIECLTALDGCRFPSIKFVPRGASLLLEKFFLSLWNFVFPFFIFQQFFFIIRREVCKKNSRNKDNNVFCSGTVCCFLIQNTFPIPIPWKIVDEIQHPLNQVRQGVEAKGVDCREEEEGVQQLSVSKFYGLFFSDLHCACIRYFHFHHWHHQHQHWNRVLVLVQILEANKLASWPHEAETSTSVRIFL